MLEAGALFSSPEKVTVCAGARAATAKKQANVWNIMLLLPAFEIHPLDDFQKN